MVFLYVVHEERLEYVAFVANVTLVLSLRVVGADHVLVALVVAAERLVAEHAVADVSGPEMRHLLVVLALRHVREHLEC